MTIHRYLEKFESFDGSITVTFTLISYEYNSAQSIRVPYKTIGGANYGYPMRGNQPGLLDVAVETARLVYVDTAATLDTEFDALKKAMYEGALGWLYTLGSDGTRRRARAQITAMPEYNISWEGGLSIPSTLSWQRFSDWQDPSLTSWGPIALVAASVAFNVVAGGDAPIWDAVFILKGTFTDPQFFSSDNGFTFGSTRDGSNANHWLRVDAGRNRVEFSTDAGVSWIPDFSNYVRLPGQIQLMKLNTGTNHLHYAQSGAPSATIEGSFYNHWY